MAAVRGVSQAEAAHWLGGIATTTQQHRPTTKRTPDTWKSTPADTPPKAINHPEYGRPTTTWKYRGSKGELFGYVCRFDPVGKKKVVIPYTHGMVTSTGETGWRWKAFSEPRPLYGMDRLNQRPGTPALIVEGEKTADAAQRLIPGVVVITWPGGSGAAAMADYSPLKGRRVAIWPDHDEPGRKAGDVAARAALEAGAAEVSIIEPPPDKAEGWDLADAEAEGWTLEQVGEWIKGHRRQHAQEKPKPEELPEPLPDELLPVAEFDFALLPDSLRPWSQDICERVQCPPDFVGVGIMASLAAVIGRKVGIRPQARTDWTVVPNLWALVVGRPGVLKSPALEATLAPLNRLIAQANDGFAAAFADYKKNQTVAKLRAEAGEKAAREMLKKNPGADVAALLAVDEPTAPTLKRYKANDTNAASLGELLRQNPNGLLVYRDELVSLLKGLDREDQAGERGFYLTAWNGDSSYTFDRIVRGLNLNIEAVCLSILGGTQPGRLAEYVRHAVKGGAADDGLIQRFGLLVWPDTGGTWKNVDRWPDTEAKNQAFRVFDYLDKLTPATIDANQDTDLDGCH